MRLISLGLGAAALLGTAGAAASQAGGGDKLTPPRGDDWRSALLVCEGGEKVTAVFSGPERLTVATPKGEHRLNRIKGEPIRYNNKTVEAVIQNGRLQLTGSASLKDCKPA